ncbi:MAG: SDR family oxidoreductase [Limnochordales bacterium]
MELKDKVAIITGGAGGIGKATAKLFAQEGAKVVLVDLQMEALEAAAKELGLAPDQYLLVAADVTKEEDVAGYVRQAKEKFGRIDILFNNAGIEGRVAPIAEQPAENLDKVLAVNVKGVFYGMKHVLPVMVEQQSGSIINTSSIAGQIGFPGLSPYVASKHAVIGLTKNGAMEYADKGIRVNAICPAPIETRMMRSVEEGSAPGRAEEAKRAFSEAIPMKRYGLPEEVAQLVLFLASDRSSYVNGAAYLIDGGYVAQ